MALKVAAVTGDRRLSAPERAPLGIYAKSIHAGGAKKRNSALTWRLQRLAQGALQGERVAKCQRTRKSEYVRIWRHKDTGAAFYDGLITCGSVWHCPLCAQKVTEHRRIELQAAINVSKKRGGEVYLMTLTFPHARADDLREIITRQSKALQRFKNSRTFKAVCAEIGHIGSIRALEVTWGAWHGWHPHTHDLVFARAGMLPALQRLQGAWIDALIAVGLATRSQLNDLLEASFDVQNGDYAAEYVTKFGHDPSLMSEALTGEHWGAARELTQGMTKGGPTVRRLKGLTPFALLRRRYEQHDMQSIALFAEFGRVFKGRRQLFWSPGLRDRLAVGDEVSDEAVATVEDFGARYDQVGALNSMDWKLVISHEFRGQLIGYAGEYGAAGVTAVLSELRGFPATHSDTGTESRWG